MLKFKTKKKYHAVDPDEIFLDSKNLPNFNTQQFEGRIEKPIPKRTFFLLSIFFSFIGIVFLYQLGVLQIAKGEAYLKRSEDNTLTTVPVFAARGIIYDRNKTKLAWNTWDKGTETQSTTIPNRSYIGENGFAHIVGYVSYPAKDKSGNYWQDTFIGKDGVEKFYDDKLKGKNGTRITELDVKGKIQSENMVTPPVHGNDMVLSIDSRIQKKLYSSIASMAQTVSFSGGAGVFMDIQSGEVLALTSYPEYNPNILSRGQDSKIIKGYLNDNRKVFLNRTLGGVYTPGSIVKPFIGYGALVENVITPFKKILSNGKLEIPNPYFKDKKSVFNDHGVFGWVDMKKAIAVSSDVYFYQIGGGFQDQKGLGIVNIDKYVKTFGMSQKTGIDLGGEKSGLIPTPEWKLVTFKGDPWRVGDTYNTSIGQYGFQVTPVQMVRAVASIANGGTLVTPHVLFKDNSFDAKKTVLPINTDAMKVVKEGMRMAVTEGTATALNIPGVQVAAKSGTAQLGVGNTNTNSWIIGFFPYENPKYAFVVLMERGPKAASGNATRVASEVIDYMKLNTPEYFK
jgi:penicillin-binding protein 2